MYYYQTITQNVVALEKSTTPYATTDEATKAAKDSLASMYVPDWPVDIRIFNGPPDDQQAYLETWSTVWEDEIQQHALKRIEEANRAEFGAIIETAHADSRRNKEQYERGLMTPLDFAKAKASIWAQAAYDIESKM